MRLLAKLFASVLIVVGVTLLTVVALLHTQYGLPLVKHAISSFSSYDFEAEELQYDMAKPFTLAFVYPKLLNKTHNEQTLQADFVAAAWSPSSLFSDTPQLSSMVIKGAALSDTWKQTLPGKLQIKHIALDDISYSGQSFAFKQAAIQLTDWQNSDAKWGDWQGQFLFSAPQVEVDSLPISNLLLDSEKQNDDWEIWGLSFNSPWGNVTGSATLSGSHQWLFHQLTLSDAQLEHSAALDHAAEWLKGFSKDTEITFRRLDLLDISASFDTLTVEHLNASLQGLTLKQGDALFSATPAALSFNTSLLRYKDWVMTDMLAEAALGSSGIKVNAFSTQFDDIGFLSFSGSLTPDTLQLDELVVSGLSLNADDAVFQSVFSNLITLPNVQLANVTVKHSSLVSLDPQFPIQVVGLNLRGESLTLKNDGQLGLWQGKLSASAASASINRIPVSSPYFSMTSENGDWQINPLSVSFVQGQLAVAATIDLATPSMPWNMTLNGLSVPNDLYERWLDLPLAINGEHDIDLSLSGLAGNEDSFAYSLSGELSATPHRMWIHSEKGQSLSQGVLGVINHNAADTDKNQRPLSTSRINLHADRGRIQLSPVLIKEGSQSVSLSGRWDLVSGEADVNLSKK